MFRSLFLKRPSPLVFPGGRPGLNPNHPAAKNLKFSGVPAGANLTGIAGLAPGPGTSVTATAVIDGWIGPTVNGTATMNGADFPSPATQTMAAIVRVIPQGGNGVIVEWRNPSFASYLSLGGNFGSIQLVSDGGSFGSPTFANGVDPYFIAASNNGTTCNLLVKNLLTGAVFTTAGAGFPAPTTGLGNNFYLNNAGFPTAAVMFSGTFLSMGDLLTWSEDPWSFWYPKSIDLGAMLKAPSSAAVADVVGAKSGVLFTPRQGPTRGLRPTNAFPDPIPPPLVVGRTPLHLFNPGDGPTRGLSPTRAFAASVGTDANVNVPAVSGTGVAGSLTPSVATGALAQAAGTGVAGGIVASVATGALAQGVGTGVAGSLTASVATGALGQAAGTGVAGSIADSEASTLSQAAGTGVAGSISASISGFLQQALGTGVAGTITVTGVVVPDVVGMKQGFLFHPGKGPTWNIQARWAYPDAVVSAATNVNVPAVSGTGVARAMTPSVSTGALAQAAGTGVAGSIASSVAPSLQGASGTGVAGSLTPSVATGALGQASGTGVAGAVVGAFGSFGALGQASGTGVAGGITASISGFFTGATGTGVARALVPQVSVNFLGVTGTGVAGSVSGQVTGGTLNVGVIGVAGIGVAGIITVSGVVPPAVVAAGGGSRKKRKPLTFLPVPRPGKEPPLKTIAQPKREAPIKPVAPEPLAPSPKLNSVLGDVEGAEKIIEQAKLKREARIAKSQAAYETRQERKQQYFEAKRQAAIEADEREVEALIAKHLEYENQLRDKASQMLAEIMASIEKS